MQRIRNGSPFVPTNRLRRTVMTVAAMIVLLPANPVAADAPGPTDYRSTIVSIEPPSSQVHPSVIGGDSFLALRVERGTTVEVLGYRSEPFIQFLADGTVQENRTSASYFVSRSRLGDDLPPGFTDGAEPDWHTVATDGRYAWHDHRIHWMTDSRPPGKRPGDVVLRQDVPLLVDGVPTAITVESTWMPAASVVPAWLGAGFGLTAGVLAGFGRNPRWRSLPMLGVAVLATVVGVWHYASLPAETGPQLGWFAFPAIATLAAGATVASARRGKGNGLTAYALVLLTGVNLFAWAWSRREVLTSAILPTHAPGWFDRFTTTAAAAAGLVAVVVGLVALVGAIVAPGSATSATTG